MLGGHGAFPCRSSDQHFSEIFHLLVFLLAGAVGGRCRGTWAVQGCVLSPSLLVPAPALPPHFCFSLTWPAQPGWWWDPSMVSHHSRVSWWNSRRLQPRFELLIEIVRSPELCSTQALWFWCIRINLEELEYSWRYCDEIWDFQEWNTTWNAYL